MKLSVLTVLVASISNAASFKPLPPASKHDLNTITNAVWSTLVKGVHLPQSFKQEETKRIQDTVLEMLKDGIPKDLVKRYSKKRIHSSRGRTVFVMNSKAILEIVGEIAQHRKMKPATCSASLAHVGLDVMKNAMDSMDAAMDGHTLWFEVESKAGLYRRAPSLPSIWGANEEDEEFQDPEEQILEQEEDDDVVVVGEEPSPAESASTSTNEIHAIEIEEDESKDATTPEFDSTVLFPNSIPDVQLDTDQIILIRQPGADGKLAIGLNVPKNTLHLIKERIQQAALTTCPQEDTDYREIYYRIREAIRAQQHHDDVERTAHHHHSPEEQLVADSHGLSIYDDYDSVRARHSCDIDGPTCALFFTLTAFATIMSLFIWMASRAISNS
jgi:hypothetical protein